MKYTIYMRQNFPFAQNPAFTEIEGAGILTNDVMLPASIDAASRFNPHKVRLWVIGHTFGAVCAVFASCEQDAFDAACDAGKIECFMAETQDHEDESLTALGNASELHDLSDTWISEAQFDAARDILLICALCRAAESGADSLE